MRWSLTEDSNWPGHRLWQSFNFPEIPANSLYFFLALLDRQEQLLNHSPLWNGSCRQVRACCHKAATGYYCHFRQQPAPCKERFQTPKLRPPSPCSLSLIKIERTHVPISLLLEGCCGVYASSLHTGTKFEYHLHLPGRQQIPHQKHMPPLAPLLLSKTLTEADQMTFPGNKASRLYVFKYT